MGQKYTSQSASGFDSSPPPDDGSQSASNLITWAGIKSKLATPLKNLADAINTALVAAFNTSARAISSADPMVAGDNGRTIQASGTTTYTALPAATAGAGFFVTLYNAGVSVITFAPDGSEPGSTTLVPKESARFVVNSDLTGWLITNRAPGNDSFIVTLTGCTTAPTYQMYVSRIGKTVTLELKSTATGTSNTTAKTLTGLPAVYWPATNSFGQCVISDNGGSQIPATFRVDTSGVITFAAGISFPTSWTNSGTALIVSFSFTYTLN